MPWVYRLIFFALLISSFTGYAENETPSDEQNAQSLENELEREHYFSINCGVSSINSKKLNQVYNSYLESSPSLQDLYLFKYHLFASSDTHSTFGFSLDYLRMSSTKSTHYSFGDTSVSFVAHGFFVGVSYLHKLNVKGLHFIGTGQAGVTSEDITIGTPVGDVTYNDFNSQKSFDSYALRGSAGIRWDVWRKLGFLLFMDKTQVFAGDSFVSATLGVGYGL